MCTDILPTAKAATIDLDDVFACLFEPRPVGMGVFFVIRVRDPLVDLLEQQDHLSMFVLLSV